MAEIKWSDSLSLGVDEIDDQHIHLVDMANNLLLVIKLKKPQKEIKKLITELREYTVIHFNDEEAYMEKIGFPELEEHRKEHQKLTERVKTYQKTLYHQYEIDPHEVLAFLKTWLLDHILSMDMDIAKFLKSRTE